MTPEQLTSLNAVLTIVSQLGTMPVVALIVVLQLAPWVVMFLTSAAQQKRFESVVKMYENNFAQVEGIKDLAQGYRETLMWATSETTATRNAVVSNMHCPIVRKGAKPKDFDHE